MDLWGWDDRVDLIGHWLIAIRCGGLWEPLWAGVRFFAIPITSNALIAGEVTPAFWSAVAATFAALAAISTLFVQRANYLYSVRPELLLIGWDRETIPKGLDRIKFKTVRNVGRGVALHLYANVVDGVTENWPRAVMSTWRHPILAKGDAHDIQAEITLFWQNVKGDYLPITLQIYCWDVGGMRHETLYTLMAIRTGSSTFVSDSIAPNVMLTTRQTKTRAVWRLKLSRRLGISDK